MKTLSLKLPDALDRQLRTLAQRSGRTLAALVREALEARLKVEGQALQGSFLDRAGNLIGCVDGGPGDLAHNKKHLEGFGR